MGDAMDLVASTRLEDGRLWGAVAADWQVDDARAILEPADGDPLWHFLTRPRGGSKSTDLAAVLIAWLVTDAAPGARGYLAAADSEQAELVVDAASGFVSRSPSLRSLVKVEASRIVSLTSGASVVAMAADGASAFGLRPHFVVADEIGQWPATRNARQMWTALLSAMGKVKGSRLVCLTSAGSPAHWSHKVIEEARKSKRWRVHEVPGPLPWADPANLAAQRALLRPSEYARLHLNEWTAAEDSLVNPDDLEACVTLDGPLPAVPGKRYVIALDLGVKNDRTIGAVCHGDRVGSDATTGLRVSLDRMQAWQGSRKEPVRLEDVEEWAAEASRVYNGAAVVVDPWQAIGLAQRLRARGIVVTEFAFSAQSVGRLASTLALLLRNHMLALPRDEELLQELSSVRLRETAPGVVRLDHDSDGHDDRAVTLALAANELMSAPPAATFIFDDGTVIVETHEPHGTFSVRVDQNTSHLDFNENRHARAGSVMSSPFVTGGQS